MLVLLQFCFLTTVSCILCFPLLSQGLINGQNLNEPPNPGIGEESRVSDVARSRYHLFRDQEEEMIHNDQSMMKQGYDPNENDEGFPPSNLNSQYPEQEQEMRGNARFSTEGSS